MATKVTCRDQKSDKVHTKWHTYRCHDNGQSPWQRWKEPQKDRKKAESGKTLMLPPPPLLSINSSWIPGGEADLRAKFLLFHWIKFALLILSASYWLHNTKGKRTQLGVLEKRTSTPQVTVLPHLFTEDTEEPGLKAVTRTKRCLATTKWVNW